MILKLALLLVALFSLFLSIYILYDNLPVALDGREESFVNTNYNPAATRYSQVNTNQFYPNMRFSTLPITYGFNAACSSQRRENMRKAVELLEEKTVLEFQLVESDPQIEVECFEREEERGVSIAGHGGPKVIINSSLYSVILQGAIKLFSESCGYNVELHEMLHVLGFDHSSDPNSIMYNISNCNQAITQDIIDEINRLYAIEPLPDLYFQNVSSFKRGKYLNIQFAVLNQGLVDAKNIKVVLYADDVMVDDFSIEEVEIGAGKIIYAQNLRLPSSDVKLLKLVIDKDDAIDELDKKNNVLEMIPG